MYDTCMSCESRSKNRMSVISVLPVIILWQQMDYYDMWCWENCVTVLDYPSLSEYLINLDAVFTTYAGCT